MTLRLLFSSLLVLVPVTAAAQSMPAIEIRSALGASHYLHADLDYTAPTFLVSLRVGTPAIAIEPEFAFARHDTTRDFLDAHVSERAEFKSAGLNVVRRWQGSIAPFVGGGVGVFSERRRTQTSTRSGDFSSDRTDGPRGGLQALGGVDVRLTSRVALFGEMRYEIRSLTDPGGGSVVQGFGGMAFALR